MQYADFFDFFWKSTSATRRYLLIFFFCFPQRMNTYILCAPPACVGSFTLKLIFGSSALGARFARDTICLQRMYIYMYTYLHGIQKRNQEFSAASHDSRAIQSVYHVCIYVCIYIYTESKIEISFFLAAPRSATEFARDTTCLQVRNQHK